MKYWEIIADRLHAEGRSYRIAEHLTKRGALLRDFRDRVRTADVSKKVAGHLESVEADEILSHDSQVEKIDIVARCTFGLDTLTSGSSAVALNVLSGGRTVVKSTRRTNSNPFRRDGSGRAEEIGRAHV